MTADPVEISLARKAARIVAPPPKLTISEWADRERRLSAESSAEPGRWNSDRAPYQRGPMDAVSNPEIETVVLMMGAQVGKTELLLNMIGYHIHQDPAPMLLVQPSLVLAEAFSKDRLAPMIRDSPALAERVADAKSRDSGNTLLHKKFPGGQITMAGANSPSSLASRPVRFVLCDEVDRYPESAGGEGDPVDLAQKRASTFHNRKYVLTSTPTIEGASRIQKAFEESDQRRFHVPCPLCEGKQVLLWPGIEWETDENGRPKNVRYKCAHCREYFDDSQKDWMLLNGEWIAEAPFKGTAGFHISELYSPWRRWSEMVGSHLQAKKSPTTLKVWVNTALGETWKEKGDAPDWQRLYERRETYKLNRVPREALFLTAGVDVQKDRLEMEIVAWAADKQSWSIDYRVFIGDTATPTPWRELDKTLMEQWPQDETGVEMPIRMLAVDSGFNTQHVYNWARRYPPDRVMVIKGMSNSAALVGQPSAADTTFTGKRLRRGFRVWPVGVGIAKSELYAWLRLAKPVDGEPHPPGYCHLPEYPDEYFQQLTAEELHRKVVKGFARYEWVKTRERNEAIDCRVYARAAASRLGLDRLRPEALVKTTAKNPGPTSPLESKPIQPKKPKKKVRSFLEL